MDKSKEEDDTELVVYDDPLKGIQNILEHGFPKKADLTTLFSTPEGKRFAQQVEEQRQFTLVGILLPMMFEIAAKVLPRLPEVFSDERFKDWWEHEVHRSSEIEDEKRALVGQFPEMMELAFSEGSENSVHALGEDLNEVFGKRARDRFVGNMVFSLHSYVQAYVDSIIESLIREDSMRNRFLQSWDRNRAHLRLSFTELDEISGDKYDIITELVRRSLPSNLPRRMRRVCEAIGCIKEFNSLVSSYGLQRAIKELEYLCEWRNVIAHGEPAPDIDAYGLEFEQTDWNQLKGSIIEEILKVWHDPPDTVFTIIELVCDWAEETSPTDYLSMLQELPVMALALPALFDHVINKTRNQSKQTELDTDMNDAN